MQDEDNILLGTFDFMQQQYSGHEEPGAQYVSTLFCDVCGSDSVQVSLCGELDEEYTCVCAMNVVQNGFLATFGVLEIVN